MHRYDRGSGLVKAVSMGGTVCGDMVAQEVDDSDKN